MYWDMINRNEQGRMELVRRFFELIPNEDYSAEWWGDKFNYLIDLPIKSLRSIIYLMEKNKRKEKLDG